MSSIKIALDTRRAKIDGTFPIVFRIRHEKKYHIITSIYSVRRNKFNEHTQSIIGNKSATQDLHKMLNNYSSRLVQLINKKEKLTMFDIRHHFSGKAEIVRTLESFWKDEAKKLIDSGRAGGARAYLSSLSGLSKALNVSSIKNRKLL